MKTRTKVGAGIAGAVGILAVSLVMNAPQSDEEFHQSLKRPWLNGPDFVLYMNALTGQFERGTGRTPTPEPLPAPVGLCDRTVDRTDPVTGEDDGDNDIDAAGWLCDCGMGPQSCWRMWTGAPPNVPAMRGMGRMNGYQAVRGHAVKDSEAWLWWPVKVAVQP